MMSFMDKYSIYKATDEETIENTISQLGNYQWNNNDNYQLYLCFYPNGSYVISDSQKDNGLLINKNLSESFLLQCYDNGCVNKVPIENILELRRDFEYSNGTYKNAELQNNLILGSNDYVATKYSSVEGVKYRFIRVSSIVKTHTILGLKGTPLITDAKDSKISWHPMVLSATSNIPPSVIKLVLNESTILSDKDNLKIVQWLDCNVFVNKCKNAIEISFEEEIITFILNKEYVKIKEIFNKYTTGPNVVVGQSMAQNVVASAKTKDILWTLIKLLLECNAGIYIKPIIDAINDNEFLQALKPDTQLFEVVLKSLFAQESKFHHTISLVYLYRDCIDKRIENIIRENVDKLPNNPEYYMKFARILNLSFDEEVKILIEDGSQASYYRLYELLYQYKQNHSASKAKLLAKDILSKILDKSYHADVIKKLIGYCICDSKVGINELILLQNILNDGFERYHKECMGRTNRIKSQEQIRNAHKHIGEYRTCIVKKEYQNHYGLTSLEGMCVILPKKYCSEQLQINKSIKVQIVHVDEYNHIMFVAEYENVTSKEILEIPLLNVGDKIEVSFYQRSPKAHGCHGLIKVQIVSLPKFVNFKKRYVAQVINRKDLFTYEVKLIKCTNQ